MGHTQSAHSDQTFNSKVGSSNGDAVSVAPSTDKLPGASTPSSIPQLCLWSAAVKLNSENADSY